MSSKLLGTLGFTTLIPLSPFSQLPFQSFFHLPHLSTLHKWIASPMHEIMYTPLQLSLLRLIVQGITTYLTSNTCFIENIAINPATKINTTFSPSASLSSYTLNWLQGAGSFNILLCKISTSFCSYSIIGHYPQK